MSTPTTDNADIATKVRTVLGRQFGDLARTVDAASDFADSLPSFDSLAALEFISAVEDEFGIEVDFVGDDVRHNFSTVDRVVMYVAERVEDAA